jgi:DNA-binding NtrC family response regulator
LIRSALESSESRIEAALKLGISPRTLRYKLARLRETSPALALNVETHSHSGVFSGTTP